MKKLAIATMLILSVAADAGAACAISVYDAGIVMWWEANTTYSVGFTASALCQGGVVLHCENTAAIELWRRPLSSRTWTLVMSKCRPMYRDCNSNSLYNYIVTTPIPHGYEYYLAVGVFKGDDCSDPGPLVWGDDANFYN